MEFSKMTTDELIEELRNHKQWLQDRIDENPAATKTHGSLRRSITMIEKNLAKRGVFIEDAAS